MKIFKEFEHLDQFGVPLKLQIIKSKTYKSNLGGAISLAIYLSSLAYTVYITTTWLQGELLPKIQQQVEVIKEDLVYEGDETLFKLEFGFVYQNTQMFRQIFTSNESRYFLPQFVQYTGLQSGEKMIPYNVQNCQSTYNQTDAVCLNQKELGLQLVQSKQKINQKNIIAHMIICDSNIFPGASCENKQVIEDYLTKSGPMTLNFQISTNQYNYKSKKLDDVPKEYFFYLDGSYYYYAQFNLKITFLTIYEGIIFPTKRTISYISDVEVQMQQFIRQEQNFALSTSLISLSPSIEIINVQYVTLGEVLAQLGSIVSLFLMVRYGVIAINQEKLQQLLKLEILRIYFPELKSKKILTNFLGQIIQIDGLTFFQTKQFLRKHKRLFDKHLSFIDLLHRLAIIQWAIFHLFPKDLQPILRNQGFKINNKQMDFQQMQKISSPPTDLNLKSDKEDMNLNDVILEEENLEENYFQLFDPEMKVNSQYLDETLNKDFNPVSINSQDLLNFYQGSLSLSRPQIRDLV